MLDQVTDRVRQAVIVALQTRPFCIVFCILPIEYYHIYIDLFAFSWFVGVLLCVGIQTATANMAYVH